MTVRWDFSNLDCEIASDISTNSVHYKEAVKSIVKRALPQDFFSLEMLEETKRSILSEHLPIIRWVSGFQVDGALSVLLLCKYRMQVSVFFYDLVSRWLVPGKKLNVEMFFAADFRFPELSEELFTASELIIKIRSQEELESIKQHIRTIETEIRLGVISDFHASRIMEFKGYSEDRKTAMIQEKIGSLMHSKSENYGKNMLSHMQHFLVTCKDEFKSAHDHHHISRIISILYMIRKNLSQKMIESPQKRHVVLKFVKGKLFAGEKNKPVLGVLVGLNLLKESEVFDHTHLIKAIHKFLPATTLVENSVFTDKKIKNSVQALYLEVAKNDEMDFSLNEIELLKENLPLYLKDHVEVRVPSTFMPPNEEDIARNIMVLSRQLRYIRDIPQVVISFDKQTGSDLSYTVIMLRIATSRTPSVEDVFKENSTPLRFVFDRVKRVGNLRRTYIKEANVFRVHLPSLSYLREDHTVDLHKARLDVLKHLTDLFGEIRDYNGGMILKQSEIFTQLKNLLGPKGDQNELLLEKFFYSIAPAEMIFVFPAESLKKLFLLLLERMKNTPFEEKKQMKVEKEANQVFIVIPFENEERNFRIFSRIDKMQSESSHLLSFSIHTHDLSYQGYIFSSSEEAKLNSFLSLVEQIILSRN